MRAFDRKAWSHLKREVTIYGEDNWGRVTARMRLHGYDINSEECRRYWQNWKTETWQQQTIWTFRDNQNLAWAYEKYGENWCRYSSIFPFFTHNEIREHYETTIRGHREEYLFFDVDGQPDMDQSPDYRMRFRNMYCPASFRLTTKQKFYHKWCENRNRNCSERRCIYRSPNGTREVTCPSASFKCKSCGNILNARTLTIDHIYPVDAKLNEILQDLRKRKKLPSKSQIADWYNDLRNLQPMCRSCNSRKGNKIN